METTFGRRSAGSTEAADPYSILYKTRSDADLVDLARAGNHAAFDEITARYCDRVYTLALQSLGDEEAAADALCDTFVSAYRDIESPDGRWTARTWIHLHALRAVLSRMGQVDAA